MASAPVVYANKSSVSLNHMVAVNDSMPPPSFGIGIDALYAMEMAPVGQHLITVVYVLRLSVLYRHYQHSVQQVQIQMSVRSSQHCQTLRPLRPKKNAERLQRQQLIVVVVIVVALSLLHYRSKLEDLYRQRPD